MPAYVPDLTSYCRDPPLFLVHTVLQHLLDFLSRRLVFLLRVIDREPGLSVLCRGAILVLDI